MERTEYAEKRSVACPPFRTRAWDGHHREQCHGTAHRALSRRNAVFRGARTGNAPPPWRARVRREGRRPDHLPTRAEGKRVDTARRKPREAPRARARLNNHSPQPGGRTARRNAPGFSLKETLSPAILPLRKGPWILPA